MTLVMGNKSLVIIAVVVMLCGVFGQEKEKPEILPIKIDESSVLSSMLRVVDQKFDTLSTRITSLEQAVGSLQFYSLRQFKIINTNLNSINSFIHGVHGQMTQLDTDSRAVKIAVEILDQDITEYADSNRDLLEDLSKTITQIDKTVHEKNIDIQDKMVEMEERIVGKITNIFINTTATKPTPTSTTASTPTTTKQITVPSLDKSDISCKINMSDVKRHIDRRIVDLKQFTMREISAHMNNFSNILLASEAMLELQKPLSLNSENQKKISSAPDGEYAHPEENDRVECSLLENERLFNALSNMTANIVQAVSYFRHTGSLFEAIITNTDAMALDQNAILNQLAELKSGIQGQNFTGIEDRGVRKEASETILVTNSDNCSVAITELRDIMLKSRNESLLLDVVARHILNTSVSLTNTLVGLQDETYRLNDIGEKLSEAGDETKMATDITKLLHDILNHTKLTYSASRIIASNTGWMPHTFRRVSAVGEQINKSLEITKHLYGDFSNVFDIQISSEEEKRQAQRDLNHAINGRAQTAYSEQHSLLREDNTTTTPSSPLLNLIFDTNKELKRIMPALTRLIAEPEPLYTLINGKTDNEGRLEVYYNGQWGTICGPNLDHSEASAVCRNLGYFGGVAAPKGSFGPGIGGFWGMNKTCLRSQRCPVIIQRLEIAHCNHDDDVGIICDHMMRLIDMDGFISRSRGRLQLHHMGRWRPVCSRSWKEREVRTACRQLGFRDGRLVHGGEVKRGVDNLFVSNIICEEESDILHTCGNDQWKLSKCNGYLPVALACQ